MGSLIDHRNKLESMKDFCRISNSDISTVIPKIDYDGMMKPPIWNYIPIQVINQIYNLIHDPKLMARPSKKYKMMNDILRPFGIRHLASGTNRRSFYCAYDETIVFKIGIDSVGEEANLMEYYAQNVLKPFCAKMYDVTPNGTIALSERVETMTEEEYRQIYCDNIFDLIFMILNRGYIMEDVGVNFFKNWGVRYGFGPVVLDYPYVYQVDWTKLKCIRRDPITGDKCLGDLDYNYRKGMSEIICKKCGARYNARDLALRSNIGMTQINDRRKRTMPLINTNIKVAIRRNGKIVNRFYAEDEVKRDPNKTIKGEPQHIVTSTLSANTTLGNEVTDRVSKVSQEIIKKAASNKESAPTVEKHYHFYPRDLKNDIIHFLKIIERNHDAKTALELADKLEVKFYTTEQFREKYGKNNENWKDRSRLETNQLDAIGGKEEEKPVEKKIDKQVVPKATVIEPEEIKEVLHPVDHEEAMKMADAVISTINEPVVIGKEEKKEDDNGVVTDEDPNHQKTNLFPVKPMTPEEIEEAELKKRNENAVMGFPGEPLVDQMKFKEMMPRIKAMVNAKYNNFKTVTKDVEEISNELSLGIKAFIMEDIKVLTNDVEALNVEVKKIVDERNNDCYSVVATNRGSALFETVLYPFKEEEIEDTKSDNEKRFEDLMKDKAALEQFFSEVAKTIDLDDFKGKSVDDCRNDLIAHFYVSLFDKKEHTEKEPYASSFKEAREAATEFVDKHYRFNEDKEEKEEERTAADEL